MLSKLVRTVPVVTKLSARGMAKVGFFSDQLPKADVATEEWTMFPRETEFRNYAVNFSLIQHGITGAEKTYHNARLPVLLQHLPVKAQNNTLDLSRPAYKGAYTVLEAGDGIPHGRFAALLEEQDQHLAELPVYFVEDAALGTSEQGAVGARIVTKDPAMALIARSLMVPLGPYPVSRDGRCRGWNLDERVNQEQLVWYEDTQEYKVEKETVPREGQRPIVAVVSGPGSGIAMQFLEYEKDIVGANIIAGEDAPVEGLVEAMGNAAAVVINHSASEGVALPSAVVTKNGKTYALINATEEVLAAAVKAGSAVYCRGHAVLSDKRVSALWNGSITSGAVSNVNTYLSLPTVAVAGQAVAVHDVDNAVPAASKLIFCGRRITSEEAPAALLAMADDKKEAIIKSILAKAQVVGAESAKDIAALLF